MTKKSGLAQWKMETHLYGNILGDIDVTAKVQRQDVGNQLGVQEFAYSKGWQTEV